MIEVRYKEFSIHCASPEEAASFFLLVAGRTLQPAIRLKEAIEGREAGTRSSGPRPQLSSETKERVRQELAKGLKPSHIASLLGMPVGTINYLKQAWKKRASLERATAGQTAVSQATKS